MRIGVVSDTHGYFDPVLRQLFEGVDAIIHAGDVGSRDVLDELNALAPVTAVKGNVDSLFVDLPLSSKKQFGGIWIETLHILPAAQGTVEEWRRSGAPNSIRRQAEAFLTCFSPATRVVVFGHSHEPACITWAGKLFLNPGSAGHKRFSLPRCCARMDVESGALRVKFEGLGGYNKGVPEELHIRLEELGSW
jgi:putative phosphoesterase